MSTSAERSKPDPTDSGKQTSGSGNVFLMSEEARAERSREYRRRYKQRQKEKDELMYQRLEETQKELEQLRLEHNTLVNQSNALESLSMYSTSMLDALNAAAAKARSFGDKALEGMNSFRGWAKHQWVMLPTVAELLSGSVYSPSDEQMRWLLKISNPEEFYGKHTAFVDRLARILEEGNKSPEAQKHAELKVNYLINTWVRFSILMHKEYPEVLEDIVCKCQLKALRQQAAEGKYIRPRMLESGPELVGCISLSSQQVYKMELCWKDFTRDITNARAILETYTSKAADGVEAAMATGQYNPGSSKETAESFLLVTEAASASDEFLLREGQAFVRLFIGAIQVLTPMQVALILTNCRPLIAHLPDVCNMLLHRTPNIEGQDVPFIEYYNGQ